MCQLQSEFYSAACGKLLRDLVRNAEQSEVVARLLKVWQQKLSYRLVRARRRKQNCPVRSSATCCVTRLCRSGVTGRYQRFQLALATSQIKPDVVYLTGGSARSPPLRAALQQALPDTPIAGGDDFASVTAGLARWAEVMFR